MTDQTTDGRPSVPQLHPFFVTFGVQYSHEPHPYWKGADPNGWVRIMAKSADAAYALAHAYFGERYAFLYPADRFDTAADREFYPLGEIALIEQGNLAMEGDGPKPIASTSEPEMYGVPSQATVACRIEGILKHGGDADAIEKLGYEVEYVHPGCFEAGSMMFASISEVDRNVMAYELDWSVPYECPVCEVSIT